MQKLFLKFYNYIPGILIAGFLTLSLFDPLGNKFDVGRSIFLTLFFALIALFISFVSFLNCQNNQKKYFEIITLFFFFLFSFFSFIYSETANFGFTEILMLGSVILIYLRGREKLFDHSAKFLYGFSIFLTIFTSIFGYISYFFSHHNRDFGFFYNPDVKTDAWPNAFALFVLMLWPILFHFVFCARKKDKWKSIKFFIEFLKIFSLSIVFASFFLSFSRAAFIAFAGQVLLLAIFSIYRKVIKEKLAQKIFPKIFFVIILSFLLIQFGQFARSHFQENLINFEDRAKFANGEQATSVQERIDFWQGAVKLTEQKPWLGYGPMSFGFVYRGIQENWLAIADHPHNWFLKLSSERGIPAALFFLLFLIGFFARAFISMNKIKEENRFLFILLLISILGAIAHNLVDFNFNFATNYVIFWLVLSAVDFLIAKTKDEEQKIKNGDFMQKFICIVVFLIIFVLTTHEFYTAIYGKLAAKALDDFDLQASSKYFAVYEKTFFPRYLYWEQADRAVAIGDFKKAAKYYLLREEKNPYDAVNYFRLGLLYRDKLKDLNKAKISFEKAIFLDPRNNWSYYLDYVKTLELLADISSIQNVDLQVHRELKDYFPKLEQDLHFESYKENPKSLFELLDILKRYE